MNVNEIKKADYPAWRGMEKADRSAQSSFGESVKAASDAKNVVHIDPDALFSMQHVKTGECANIYRADDYSEDNPVYLVKGIDKNGKEYEQRIDVNKVNPNHCSYIEMLALNLHTGNKSDADFLRMSVLKDKAGNASYHEKADYMAMAQELMNDMKTLGNWEGYLRYDKWINDILAFKTQKSGADKDRGDITVFSGMEFTSGSSYSVSKTQDFDPANPVYKVKICDKSGNVMERMVDISKVDPKNCDTAELYAYTANLKESGKGSFEDTVLKAVVAKSVRNAEQKNAGSWSFSDKTDWVKIVKDIMQSEYRYGDLNGYMEWKKFLGFLE